MWRKYFDTGLWFKEFRQARMMLGAMLVLGFGAFPLTRMSSWWFESPELIKIQVENMNRNGLSRYSDLDGMFQVLTLVMCILAAILSLWQMGYERKSGIQEFTFSLPYSRKTIYITKWLLGASLAAGTSIIVVFLDIIVILTSPLAPYMDWSEYFMYTTLLLLLTLISYTGSLFIGAVAGSWSTQVIFTGIMLFLPIYIDALLRAPIEAFQLERYMYRNDVYSYSLSHILLTPIFNDPILRWLAMIVLIIAFLISGLFAYERNRVENNGKLVNIPAWENVLIIGVVICCGLLGGYTVFLKIEAGNSMGGYIVGFLLASAIGYLIIKTMTRMRLKR